MDKQAAVAERDQALAFDFPVRLLKAAEDAGGEFHIVGYAATTDFDLQGDIITEEALANSADDLIKNSTVLLNHDLKLPIGRVTKVNFDRHGLLIDALISKTETEIIQKIKEGVLNKFSIRGQVLERERRFVPEMDREVNVIKRMTLVEVSLVSVPANPEARAVGWYVSKALRELDQKPQGETPMPEEQVVIEELKPEAPAQSAPAAAPEAVKTDAAKPQPAAQPSPEPAPVSKETRATSDPVIKLLDGIAALGGEAAPLAKKAKALLAGKPAEPAPAPAAQPQPMGREDIGKMIAGEVAKQVEAALKSIPTARKGLVQPESGAEDLRKQFEGLSPEKKLKVALAMQQG